jgi:hypothetical protein
VEQKRYVLPTRHRVTHLGLVFSEGSIVLASRPPGPPWIAYDPTQHSRNPVPPVDLDQRERDMNGPPLREIKTRI